MIDLMGPDTLGVWFLLLAMIFSVSIWAGHMIYKQARKDQENLYFFEKFAPAGWRDFKGSLAVITVLVLLALILWIIGEAGFIAVVGLLFAAAALMRQLHLSHITWMHSMVMNEEG
jgi:hypothetical protein